MLELMLPPRESKRSTQSEYKIHRGLAPGRVDARVQWRQQKQPTGATRGNDTTQHREASLRKTVSKEALPQGTTRELIILEGPPGTKGSPGEDETDDNQTTDDGAQRAQGGGPRKGQEREETTRTTEREDETNQRNTKKKTEKERGKETKPNAREDSSQDKRQQCMSSLVTNGRGKARFA